jgi:hypothetical protein
MEGISFKKALDVFVWPLRLITNSLRRTVPKSHVIRSLRAEILASKGLEAETRHAGLHRKGQTERGWTEWTQGFQFVRSV